MTCFMSLLMFLSYVQHAVRHVEDSADHQKMVSCHQGYEAAADANQRIPLQCCVEGQPMAPTRCPFDEDGQCSAETGRLDAV